MNIFLGSIYPQSLLEELTTRKLFADYPANVFQQSLVGGLDEHWQDLRVISSPVIKSPYLEVRDICKRCTFSHNSSDEKKDVYVGTLALPGIQMLSELWRVFCAIRKVTKVSRRDNNLVIYALHSPFLLAAVLLRKRIRCSCVVVPDLPEYMSKQGSLIKRIGKKIDRSIINYCLKHIDTFVLLSSYMRDKLPIDGKPWALMEGIFNTNAIPKGVAKCQERVILYCGNLSKQYGIVELLEAFKGVANDNYRLWICGRGDSESDVIKMAEEDKRIMFYGVVSHEEVLELQQKATVLINPRSSAGEYTKYSFPSKTMEYLASGTPTIMSHLPAIPKEYDKHIFYFDEETVDGIRNKIAEVYEKPQDELSEFGKSALEFIKTQKNAYVQAKKIIDLINSNK